MSYKNQGFLSPTVVAKLPKDLSAPHRRLMEPQHQTLLLTAEEAHWWCLILALNSAFPVLLAAPTSAQCLCLVSKRFLRDFLTGQMGS